MIPIRLELYNFLAYRGPVMLDLEGLHVACLAGANGAGKSSLLDAMTWALWGKARARRDDELIHYDMPDMRVSFDFSLGGDLYQVVRYRSREARGRSLLNLSILDGDEWRSIGEATLRGTQARINNLLRLDYDTFINSVLLLQDRADEFTLKTPAERKRILAEILGLSAWEVYEERAKIRLRHIEQEQGQLGAELDHIAGELAREDEYQQALIEALREKDELKEQLDQVEARVHQIEQARSQQKSLQERQTDFLRRIAQAERELERVGRDIQAQYERIERFRATQEAREEIEAGYAGLLAARQAERDLGDRLMVQTDLLQRQSDLREAIFRARGELEAEARALETRIADLEWAIAEALEDSDLGGVGAEIAGLEAKQAERDDLRDQVAALKEEAAALHATNRTLSAEMRALEMQIEQVKDVAEPACPLCGQPLDETHRQELLAQFEQEGREKGEVWRANHARLDEITDAIEDMGRRVGALDGELRRLPALRERQAVLIERDSRASLASEGLKEAQARREQVRAALDAEDYAHDVRAELDDVRAQLIELGYDDAAHQAARARIDEYQAFEWRKADLDHALEEIPQAEGTIADLQKQAAAWQATLDEDRAALDTIAADLDALAEELADAEQVEAEYNRLRDEVSNADLRVGAAQQRLDALDARRLRQSQLADRAHQLADQQAIYDELRTAFGKNGVPAMIIDAAIPEIQNAANDLLARLTDGRLTLELSTQREKVTGGIAETLDIRIHEGGSTRDYDLFSGGESFRINFALRIALSKLLARRAGAQLRTLVIDEGFGSQDAQGRERLVEAIHAIRDDFDLILVITHIDELKDAFPVRIEVTKTPAGSQIDVM
jgi:exonuclease SbcC